MSNLLVDTETFLRAADHPIPDVPAVPSSDVLALRLSLLLEEVAELFDACGIHPEEFREASTLVGDNRTGFLESILDVVGVVDLVELVDAFHDITVIAHGGALESAGSAVGETAAEVGGSNLLKIVDGKVERRPDGKIQKPEKWRAPDIEGVLKAHGWEG